MSEPSQPPPSSVVPSLDLSEVQKAVREELDRQNKYLEFAQGQITKDREFYKHLYTYATAFIGAIVVIASVFSYTSVAQMRTDMKASVDAELTAVRAQAAATSDEAKATVAQELANVRTEVQRRIETEFRSENITALVENAAKDRTAKELNGIIRSETAAQVAQGIKAESPTIQKSVESQTREAVKALQPTITTIVRSELQAQIDKAVAPVEAQMQGYQKLNTLSALARNDDRDAFDQLIELGTNSPAEEVRNLSRATVLEIVRQKNSILHRMAVQFQQPQTPVTMKQFLQSSLNKDERLAAIDNFPLDDPSILPILVDKIRTDHDLEVVATAFKNFNVRTKQAFQFPDYKALLSWWDANRSSYGQK